PASPTRPSIRRSPSSTTPASTARSAPTSKAARPATTWPTSTSSPARRAESGCSSNQFVGAPTNWFELQLRSGSGDGAGAGVAHRAPDLERQRAAVGLPHPRGEHVGIHRRGRPEELTTRLTTEPEDLLAVIEPPHPDARSVEDALD